MGEINLQDLLKKYKAGACTSEELIWLENWYFQWKVEKQHFTDEELIMVKDEVWQEMAKNIRPVKQVKLWKWSTVAAAAVAIIVFGAGLFYAAIVYRQSDAASGSSYTNDVAPGSNKAMLTLSDGKTINLIDAKTGVVVDPGMVRYASGGGAEMTDPLLVQAVNSTEQLTVSTPKGGTYQVRLSDGTQVWLNADSKITFPSQFSGKERSVTLNGEAYFEVAKVKTKDQGGRMPFIVVTDQQQVQVLGTHFNVNSYEDEGSTKTTLLEGIVRVQLTGRSNKTRGSSAVVSGNDDVVLKPGQQSVVTGHDRIKTKEVNTASEVAWKNGQFMFADEDIKSIMRKVARWYDVEIIYEQGFVNRGLIGTISKFEHISKVLKMLELTGTVHFKVEGRRITVMQ